MPVISGKSLSNIWFVQFNETCELSDYIRLSMVGRLYRMHLKADSQGSFRLSQASLGSSWAICSDMGSGLRYIYIYIAHTRIAHTAESCCMRYIKQLPTAVETQAQPAKCVGYILPPPLLLHKQWMKRVVVVFVVAVEVYQVEIAQLVGCCHNKPKALDL